MYQFLFYAGLEKSLEVVDLSGNRLTRLPDDIFAEFDALKKVRLDGNMMANLQPNVTFQGSK